MPWTALMPVPTSQIGRPTELAGRMHDPAHTLRDQVKAAAQPASGAGPKATSTIAVPTGSVG
jgi:hypothetical protein